VRIGHVCFFRWSQQRSRGIPHFDAELKGQLPSPEYRGAGKAQDARAERKFA
jgi:hypothetical protein